MIHVNSRFVFRLCCHGDSGMCPELPAGCGAAGHLLGNHILPGLGLDDGALWRPAVGGSHSYQRPSQKKLVLDQMVRNQCVSVSTRKSALSALAS